MENKIFALKKRLIVFVLIFHIVILVFVAKASQMTNHNKKESIVVNTIVIKPSLTTQSTKFIPENPKEKILLNTPVAFLPVPIYKKEVATEPKEEKKAPSSEHVIKKAAPRDIKKTAFKPKSIPQKKPISHHTPLGAKKNIKTSNNKKMKPRKVYTIKNPKIVDNSSYVASAESEKIMKDIQGHFEKMDQVQLQKETKSQKELQEQKIVEVASFQSLTIDADSNLPFSNTQTSDMKDRLISELKQNLLLPDFGEVRLLLQISKEGNILNVKILSSENKKNSEYLKNQLPSLSFPWFNDSSLEEKSFEFYITFKNE